MNRAAKKNFRSFSKLEDFMSKRLVTALVISATALGSAASFSQIKTEQPWELAARLEKARNNIEPQPITPDMCIDGICVEQDLGLIPNNLAWKPPEPPLDTRRLSGEQLKAYESGMRRGLETCAAENNAIWGARAAQLCEYLILGNEKPRIEVVGFFRDNKLPVCVPGQLIFKMTFTTDLGGVRFEVHFGKDGRPKVREIVKEFVMVNAADRATLRKLINEKHPYASNSSSQTATPWGGYVWYDDLFKNHAPDYRMSGRSSIFANPRVGPDAGQCATASKSLSVK
ncbi:hypothetical protein [Variovorax sp. PCZ-1]|uniref:hypothetical protein n=1 Tax=Variovorax sp. PCZ-1 TaxID=2835533 RepID=UPI001BCF2DC4|nr:hypothetical protein [Variovorax sp. PCZ-1]MBS7809247.1 hypothetical protein [Variovorax sp. PCZ-1]